MGKIVSRKNRISEEQLDKIHAAVLQVIEANSNETEASITRFIENVMRSFQMMDIVSAYDVASYLNYSSGAYISVSFIPGGVKASDLVPEIYKFIFEFV